jgi:hypothetical protein
MKRPFLPATLFLLLALGPMYLMHRTMAGAGFPLSGFGSAVLQAEFHLDDNDVYDLYGAKAGPARAVLTEKMREAHVYDNLFLLCYGLFLIVFCLSGVPAYPLVAVSGPDVSGRDSGIGRFN